jgi:diguanylate cyclase (GGDEF)-like protein
MVLAAIALVVLIRFVVRPLHRLSRQARRLAGGSFSLPPVPPTGPREVADTIVAVDELAAALAAVEKFTVTLAKDPTAASLDAPLPGRTGVALQTTLDRLRESVRDADRQRTALRQVAMHDELTGLLNRRAALEAVQRELDRAERELIPVMALFVDLDGLKTINDTYGHAAGDDAIRLTAEALRDSARKFDVVARLGGDEFLIAGGCIGTRDDLQVLAERIHAAVGAQTLTVNGDTVSLRCCIGVALSAPGDNVETLIHEADRALYAAKRHGRDRVAWENAIPVPRAAEQPVEAG